MGAVKEGRKTAAFRIYISGGVTGIPDFKQIFKNAEDELLKEGLDVINPAIIDLPSSCGWEDYMHVTLAMLELADGIYMLKGWENSKGACAELKWAQDNNLEIYYESAKDLLLDAHAK